MKLPARYFPIAVCIVILLTIPSSAQTQGRQTNPTPQTQEQLSNVPPSTASLDTMAIEIGLLRKSLQTLNTRLRELSVASDSKQSGSANDKGGLAAKLEILTRAEQRAEVLRKQLIELIEKETSLKTRVVQIEEDMRPENIERSVSVIGTTRPAEIRDLRRRMLENERKGVESLLIQTSQWRTRLEDDVRLADSMVTKLKQRLLPLIDKEIEKINPN